VQHPSLKRGQNGLVIWIRVIDGAAGADGLSHLLKISVDFQVRSRIGFARVKLGSIESAHSRYITLPVRVAQPRFY